MPPRGPDEMGHVEWLKEVHLVLDELKVFMQLNQHLDMKAPDFTYLDEYSEYVERVVAKITKKKT